jgi:adenosylcobinamide-GDP ribazoletransferase
MRRALSFLTVLGRADVPNERTLAWFPVVGLVVGALVGSAWWAAGRLWPPTVAALVAVAADAGLTGCLHLDGLADSADGLIPPVTRERRFEIMADPRVGAFGAVALVVVLGLRVAALAAGPAKVLVVAGLWCGSRTLMAAAARSQPYAHAEGGTASAFGTDRAGRAQPHPFLGRYGVAVYGLALAGGLAALGAGSRGLVVVAVEVAGVAAAVWFARRRLGGYTGDVLGAAGVIGETLGLLALVAR